MTGERAPNSGVTGFGQIFRYAIVFGLVTGLVEATLRYTLQTLGWLPWKWSFQGVTVEIFWVAPAMLLLVFLLAAVVWSLVN